MTIMIELVLILRAKFVFTKRYQRRGRRREARRGEARRPPVPGVGSCGRPFLLAEPPPFIRSRRRGEGADVDWTWPARRSFLDDPLWNAGACLHIVEEACRLRLRPFDIVDGDQRTWPVWTENFRRSTVLYSLAPDGTQRRRDTGLAGSGML